MKIDFAVHVEAASTEDEHKAQQETMATIAHCVRTVLTFLRESQERPPVAPPQAGQRRGN